MEVYIGFRGTPSLKILEYMFRVINLKILFAISSKFQLYPHLAMRIPNMLTVKLVDVSTVVFMTKKPKYTLSIM